MSFTPPPQQAPSPAHTAPPASPAQQARPAAAAQPGTAYAARPPMDGLAIAAFVCSLCGLALIPIILGHVSLGRIKRQDLRGSAFAIVALVLGYLQLLVYAIVVVIGVSTSIWALTS